MARSPIVAKLVFNRLPELRGLLKERASQAVRKAALDVLAGTQTKLYEGHGVDTGTLKGSYQVGDRYNVFDMKPGSTSAQVGTNVEYAPHVEYGTTRMAAIPHLGPSAEEVRPSFEQAMKQLLD